MAQAPLSYILRLADSPMILGQRLTEWCGKGPILEQDIALSNIALDLLGLARNLYQYAAKVDSEKRSEDDLALTRKESEYRNFLICELENGHWGDSMARQFFFDSYHYFFLQGLMTSKDDRLKAIAEKSIKEVTYHIRFSSEWMIRLGDGTAESHEKMQQAVNDCWIFTGELTKPDALDIEMWETGIGPDLNEIKGLWEKRVSEIFKQANLTPPKGEWMQKGGKAGVHTEKMGFLLAEMQYLQRAFPGQTW